MIIGDLRRAFARNIVADRSDNRILLLLLSRYKPCNSVHGIHWRKEREINFSRLIPSGGAIIKRQIFSLLQIVLNSMHRYQPRIHLIRCRHTDDSSLHITDLQKEEHKTFIFPEAIFTAVTAYQNQLVSPDSSNTQSIIQCNVNSQRTRTIRIDRWIFASRDWGYDFRISF